MRPDQMPIQDETCGDCGMVCGRNEYHPFAACLMFKACRNGEQVRANLEAVIDHGRREGGGDGR